jgi:ATP-binding cassette subfamily B multidrug efflux pump
VIRIDGLAGWIMFVLTSMFENIGTVQEGMETISRPIVVTDREDAKDLTVDKG